MRREIRKNLKEISKIWSKILVHKCLALQLHWVGLEGVAVGCVAVGCVVEGGGEDWCSN